METTSPYARTSVRIFIGILLLLVGTMVGSHLYGYRFIKPNLESAEDRQAYGSSYTHK